MKAGDAISGDVLSFTRDGSRVWKIVCFNWKGFCFLSDGTMISPDLEVNRETKKSHFLVNPNALTWLFQFSCIDPGTTKPGQMMLFIERMVSAPHKGLDAYVIPAFYDLRSGSFWSMSGQEFSPSQYLCIDLGSVQKGFEIAYEDQAQLRERYPADI